MAVCLVPFMIIGAVPAPAAATSKSQSGPRRVKFRTGLQKHAQRPENTRRLFVVHDPVRAEVDVGGGGLMNKQHVPKLTVNFSGTFATPHLNNTDNNDFYTTLLRQTLHYSTKTKLYKNK